MPSSPATSKPALPLVREPGVLFDGTIRLDQRIASGAQGETWAATDTKTSVRYGVEFVSHKQWVNLHAPDALLQEFKQAIPAAHPDLLAFYRIAGTWPEIAVITAPYPVLREKPLLAETDWGSLDLSVALDWIMGLGHVLQELHESGLRPYGSLVPSRIVIRANGLPLLTGYPHAAFRDSSDEQAFLSPLRLQGKDPTIADDVFGLGALAYYVFTGGASPPVLKDAPSLESGIEHQREAQGFKPTAWAPGWDHGILSALRENPTLRPLSIRALVNSFNDSVGRPKLPAAIRRSLGSAPAAPESPRRLPPWRASILASRSRRGGSVNPSTAETNGDNDAPFQTAAKLREDKADLANLNADLRQSQATLISDLAQSNAQRAELDRRSKVIAQEMAELKAARQELESARRTLSENTARFDAEKKTLDQQAKTSKSAGETLLTEKEALARKTQDVELLTRSLMAQKARLGKDLERVGLVEEELKKKSIELESLEKNLAELQQALTQLSGGATAPQWQAFVQQLTTTKRDQDQRATKLIAEEKRVASLRAEIAALKERPSVPDIASKKPEPELEAESLTGRAPPLEKELPPAEDLKVDSAAAHTVPPIPITSTPPPPPPPPPLPEIRKATLAIGGRRLHLLAGPSVRFGRHGSTDILLVSMLNGQTQPTLALNREISRKHFELSVDRNEAMVRDGWSDSSVPSQHGVCLDGRRVPVTGAPLRTGMLLSVTTRAPARFVPHWRVLVSPRPEQAPPGNSLPPVDALFLQRLDDAPEDILVLLTSISLHDLGLSDPPFQSVSLARHAEGFAWQIGTQITPFAAGPSPIPGVTLVSLGFNSSTAVETPA